MSNSLVPKVIGTIDSYQSYGHLRTVDFTTVSSVDFFQGIAGSASDPNDLGVDAFLPENQSGYLTGLQFSLMLNDNTTNSAARQRSLAFIKNFGEQWFCEAYLGGLLITRGLVKQFGGPLPALQGLSDTGVSANNGVFGVDVSSYPMPFSDAPWFPRQSLRVRLTRRFSLANLLPSTNNLLIQATAFCRVARPLAS